MLITWDDPKRRVNLDKHGLDFAMIDLSFFASARILPGADGRSKAIGRLAGTLPAVAIFAPLGQEAISIISLRTANRKERSLLDD